MFSSVMYCNVFFVCNSGCYVPDPYSPSPRKVEMSSSGKGLIFCGMKGFSRNVNSPLFYPHLD